MTASRLQDAALARFARQGFDATSMNEIAADVGIKKPSVYAHFRNKDALFLSLIPMLVQAELAHARAVLRGGPDTHEQLHAYLSSIETRYAQSHRVQFWMRTLFAPPQHLYETVMQPMHAFMDELEGIIRQAVADSPLVPNPNGLDAETLAMTFMSLVDSLQSELLFGGTRKYRRRLVSVWAVFEVALGQASRDSSAT